MTYSRNHTSTCPIDRNLASESRWKLFPGHRQAKPDAFSPSPQRAISQLRKSVASDASYFLALLAALESVTTSAP